MADDQQDKTGRDYRGRDVAQAIVDRIGSDGITPSNISSISIMLDSMMADDLSGIYFQGREKKEFWSELSEMIIDAYHWNTEAVSQIERSINDVETDSATIEHEYEALRLHFNQVLPQHWGGEAYFKDIAKLFDRAFPPGVLLPVKEDFMGKLNEIQRDIENFEQGLGQVSTLITENRGSIQASIIAERIYASNPPQQINAGDIKFILGRLTLMRMEEASGNMLMNKAGEAKPFVPQLMDCIDEAIRNPKITSYYKERLGLMKALVMAKRELLVYDPKLAQAQQETPFIPPHIKSRQNEPGDGGFSKK